jgi:esterase/lipase
MIDEVDINDVKEDPNKELKERIAVIEQKLDRILELMENDCKKMRDHIDFVENVYDNVKTPFNYVMNSVNSIIYTNANLLLSNSNSNNKKEAIENNNNSDSDSDNESNT